MNGLSRTLVLVATLALSPALRGENVLRTIADLRTAVYDAQTRTERFELEATVTHGTDALGAEFAISDGKDAVSISDAVHWPGRLISAGARLHLAGHVAVNDLGYNTATATQVVLLAQREAPAPEDIRIGKLKDPACSDRLVRFTGTVFDAFRDETDIRFVFLIVIDEDGEIVYVPIHAAGTPFETFAGLIDAQVAVSALVIRDRKGSTKRKLASNLSHITRENIEVLTPPPADPFAVPSLVGSIDDVLTPRPGLSRRRKVRGEVTAVWHGDRVLVRREDGDCTKVILLDATRIPRIGDLIEAVGVPDTDLYHLNLSRARWRHFEGTRQTPPAPTSLSVRELLTDGAGHPQIDTHFHGCPVRVRGRVLTRSAESRGAGFVTLESEGFQIKIDASAAPQALTEMESGTEIAVTGICIVEIDSWRPQVPFPEIEECLIVIRTPEDITVLSRPPWWSTGRLLAVIGSLLVALIAIFTWNRILNRLVERRGREILREQIGRAKAALKTEERTRLAVELHDSLAQSLTGAAMEVETAAALHETAPEEMLRHLLLAGKTLQSCREDLRNSLWDLRSRALEEPDFANAIRRTLSPHLNLAKINIRFNAPRKRLTDNQAHTLLRIIRELTLNALRHGKATSVQIAGSLDDDRLLCSVTDNGCGFDPDDCPGVLQGHFGLSGIRERIQQAGGQFILNSTPRHGTKARVIMPLSSPNDLQSP